MGYDDILFLVVCYWIFLTFCTGKWCFFCILVDKGSCFFTFFEKDEGSFELKCFWCDILSEKWRFYLTFTILVKCQTSPRDFQVWTTMILSGRVSGMRGAQKLVPTLIQLGPFPNLDIFKCVDFIFFVMGL